MARPARQRTALYRHDRISQIRRKCKHYFTNLTRLQICKFTLPFIGCIYGGVLLIALFTRGLHPVFSVMVLLFAAIPLLRTAVLARFNAKLVAEERSYDTNRAKEEQILFNARSFLRVNRLTEAVLQSFHSRFEDWYHTSGSRKNWVAAVRVVFDYLCSYGAALGVVFIGALLVLKGEMSVGALMTGYLLLSPLGAFYRTISIQFEEIKKEKDWQARLSVFYGESGAELLETEDALPRARSMVKRICLQNVSFAYPGEKHHVLRDWSGDFSTQETVQIVGENGSGKTTLMRIIAGLYAPQSGKVTDENGTPLTKEELRAQVAIQEQDGYIFQGTVWDNLFAGEDKRERAESLFQSMGFAKALDFSIAARGSNLSPGERQKILTVRVLLRDAGFLILDEPLNHMDVTGTAGLYFQLQRRETGIIFISHHEFPVPFAKGREVYLETIE